MGDSSKKENALHIKERLVIVILIAMAILFGYLRWNNVRKEKVEVVLGGTTIRAEIADTIGKHERGLSWREKLGENEGMLFVFGAPDRYSFWMKEMRFPIDIIWIVDGKVADITRNLPPPREGEIPASAYPRVPVTRVLEVNAGFADRQGIKIGDEMRIKGKI